MFNPTCRLNKQLLCTFRYTIATVAERYTDRQKGVDKEFNHSGFQGNFQGIPA